MFYNIADLDGGIGGLAYGFSIRNEFSYAFGCEENDKKRLLYESNLPEYPVVKSLQFHNLETMRVYSGDRIDVLLGHKQIPSNDWFMILTKHRPSIVIIPQDSDIWYIESSLKAARYSVSNLEIPLINLGLPCKQSQKFIVGTQYVFEFELPNIKPLTLGECLQGADELNDFYPKYEYVSVEPTYTLDGYVDLIPAYRNPQRDKCVYPDGFRLFTTREIARIYGYPDSFKISENDCEIWKWLIQGTSPAVSNYFATQTLKYFKENYHGN